MIIRVACVFTEQIALDRRGIGDWVDKVKQLAPYLGAPSHLLLTISFQTPRLL